MVNDEGVSSEVIDQLLSYLIISHDHKLLDNLLTLDSLLDSDIDRHTQFIQLEYYLVFVKHFTRDTSLTPIFGYFSQKL